MRRDTGTFHVRSVFLATVALAGTAIADSALDGYAARVETQAHLAPVVDEVLCAPGEILWHRDLVTTLCAPLCTADADCIEGLKRCAAIPATRSMTSTRSEDKEPSNSKKGSQTAMTS